MLSLIQVMSLHKTRQQLCLFYGLSPWVTDSVHEADIFVNYLLSFFLLSHLLNYYLFQRLRGCQTICMYSWIVCCSARFYAFFMIYHFFSSTKCFELPATLQFSHNNKHTRLHLQKAFTSLICKLACCSSYYCRLIYCFLNRRPVYEADRIPESPERLHLLVTDLTA
jgi:hypothetical protein